MKAMILAAGKGTRVRPLTYDLPKPMIPILGKPVMEYLLEHLAGQGVRQVMVNTSHQAHRIEQYFGDGRRFGLEIGYSFEGHVENDEIVPLPLGSAGGMKKVHEFGGFFDETVVVLCGDALVDLDLGLALAEHRARGAIASLMVKRVPRSEVSSYGVVVCDDDGRIRSFQEKPAAAEALSDWASTGIYIFEPRVMDLIPAGREFDIGADLFPQLVARDLPFYAQKHDFHWVDIGKVGDYWSAVQRVMRREVGGIRMPGTQVRAGLWVGLNTRIEWNGTAITGPVYVGSNTLIESGCEIVGPTWIGHGCHVEPGATLHRSIIFEHNRVGRGCAFADQIVCGKYCVSADGRTILKDQPDIRWIWEDARKRRAVTAA